VVVAAEVAAAEVAAAEVAAAEVAAAEVAAAEEVLRRLRLFLRQLFLQAHCRQQRLLTKHHQRHCLRIILPVQLTTLFVSRALVN
jgi:hypothetical protein